MFGEGRGGEEVLPSACMALHCRLLPSPRPSPACACAAVAIATASLAARADGASRWPLPVALIAGATPPPDRSAAPCSGRFEGSSGRYCGRWCTFTGTFHYKSGCGSAVGCPSVTAPRGNRCPHRTPHDRRATAHRLDQRRYITTIEWSHTHGVYQHRSLTLPPRLHLGPTGRGRGSHTTDRCLAMLGPGQNR